MRTAVVAGFALVGGIWLFAGYYFTTRMAELEQRSREINLRYTHAQDLLSTARGQILMGSVYVRDALLDPNPANAEEYRRQLEETYRSADEALRGYVPVLDVPGEQERIGRLRRELDDFRKTLLEVLTTDSRRWPAEARDLLRHRIMPKRESVMHVSEEVQALNRGAFVQQQTEIGALYRATQRRIWESFGLAVTASLGIAMVAIVYAGRLERRIDEQRTKDVETTRDLQRLSSQLLTAQEEERRTIARELHDEVGQVLTAIKVELSIAQRAPSKPPVDAQTRSPALAPSPTARSIPCAICRIYSTRRCSTISDCRPPSSGISRDSAAGTASRSTCCRTAWTRGCRPTSKRRSTASCRRR
jgi:signal transduction histidine kinase